MRRSGVLVLFCGCTSVVPRPAVLETCGLADGEVRVGGELLAVPNDECGDALLADLGASGAERIDVAWDDARDGRVVLAVALWGLLAGDFGSTEPGDDEAPPLFAVELAELPATHGTPLGHALYAYVLARVDHIHPLTGDWIFQLDPDLRSIGYPWNTSSGEPGERAIALVHAASHADPSRTHLDCLEAEVIDEGPDPTWGGAQSITVWLTTRLYERAEGEHRIALEESLPVLVSGICGLDQVPDGLWLRMNALPLSGTP